MEEVQGTLACCKLRQYLLRLRLYRPLILKLGVLEAAASLLVTRGESCSASALLTFGSDSSFSALCAVGWLASLAPSLDASRPPPPHTHSCDNQKCPQTLRNIPWGLKLPPFLRTTDIHCQKCKMPIIQFSHNVNNYWPTHTGNSISCLGFFLLLIFQAPFTKGLGGASKGALFSGWGLPLHLSSEMFSVSTCQRQALTCGSTEQLLSVSELEV